MVNISGDIKKETGFTLVELILAIAVFSILTLTMSILLSYTIKTNKILTEKSLRLEDARITMDFIQTHVKLSEKYKLNQLGKLLVLKDGNIESYFVFNTRTHKITYGDNLLAENIEDISIEVENNIMNIKIKMNSYENFKPLEIVGEVSVKYKDSF